MKSERWRNIFKNPPVLVVATLLLATLASAYRGLGFSQSGVLDPILGVMSALFLFLAVPLLTITYIYKERVSEYGWALPIWNKESLVLACAVLLSHLFAAIVLAGIPEFQEFYALPEGNKVFLFSSGLILTAAYFTAEEFLFRGFLLRTFWDRYRYVGVGVTVLLFGVLHFGKVPLEIVVALASGASLAWISLKTKSFIPAAFIHWAFALAVNVLVNFVHI